MKKRIEYFTSRTPHYIRALGLFIIISFIAYWQVATFSNTLKWDMIDGTFPNIFIESELIQSGELPLWNPYSDYGTAVHSKMTNWYPFRYLLSGIVNYSLYWLNIDFMLHITLAGFSMYLLSRQLQFSPHASVITGAGYMLSGFFLGNAQHYGWLAGGAWLPLLAFCILRFMHAPSFKRSTLLAFVSFSFITSAYPGISFTVFYIVLAYLLTQIALLLKQKAFLIVKKIFIWGASCIATIVLLSSIMIVSNADLMSNVTRGAGISLEYAIASSLNFKHLITFIFPFLNVFNKDNFWDIDISMVNCFIGLIPLITAGFALKDFKRKAVYIPVAFTGFFILLAFAKTFPIREWLYLYLPLFDLFRFPSLFRLFFIFGILLLTGYSITYTINNAPRKTIMRIAVIIAGGFSVLALYAFFSGYKFPEYTNWIQFKHSLYKSHIIFISSIVSASIFGFGAFILWRFKMKLPTLLVLCTLAELIAAVQLNIHMTAVSQYSVESCQSELKKLPKGFPSLAADTKTRDAYSNNFKIAQPIWRNGNFFHKMPAYNAYTSFQYWSMDSLYNAPFWDTVKTFQLAYIGNISKSNSLVLPIEEASIKTIEFNPNKFSFNISNKDAAHFVLTQTNYPGWKAYMDTKEAEIIPANISHMAISIPQGEHQVSFIYKPTKIIAAYYIYKTTLLILIGTLAFWAIQSLSHQFRLKQ